MNSSTPRLPYTNRLISRLSQILKILLALFLTMLAVGLFAQAPEFAWGKILHIGNRVDIVTDAHANVYTTGRFGYDSDDIDIQLAKFSSDGTDRWFRSFNPPDGIAEPVAMALSEDETSVYVLGEWYTSTDPGVAQVVLLKFDSSGMLLWERYYDVPALNDEPESIAVDNGTGEIVITGTSSSMSTEPQFFVIKYSPSGTRQWLRTGAGSGKDVAVHSDGNVFVTATTPRVTPLLTNDWTVVKFNNRGVQQWRSPINFGVLRGEDASSGRVSDLQLDEAGDVYVAGRDFEFVGLFKLSGLTGGLQWREEESVDSRYVEDNLPRIGVYNSNTIFLAFPESYGATANVAQFDAVGSKQWLKQFTPTVIASSISINDIDVDVSGNVYVSAIGWEPPKPHSTIVKYDRNGNLQWVLEEDTQVNAISASVNAIHLAGAVHRPDEELILEYASKWIQPTPTTVGVLPEALEEFDRFDFFAHAQGREWCWTDILINWDLKPICVLPPLCPKPRFNSTLTANGKTTWSKKFEQPIELSIPDFKSPQLFSLGREINKEIQNIIVLDEDLISGGISEFKLSAFPESGLLTLRVETKDGKGVPFSLTVLNAEGKSIWQKEFQAPLSVEVNEQLNERGATLKFSAVGKNFDVKYFPNPSHGDISLRLEGDTKYPAQVSVTSLQGKTVLYRTIQGEGDAMLSLKGQKPGLYIVSVKTANGSHQELIELK